MLILLQFLVFIPLVGFFLSLLFSGQRERWISTVAFGALGLHLLQVIVFNGLWLATGAEVLDLKHFVFYKEDTIEIYLDFYFDHITAVFSVLGAFITFLVAIFSSFYLHRDEGYKRFFNTLLLFYFGYNVVVFSGNFETLFIGWEFLGITSFLLIAFYRDRYLPVKNALKTISLYRVGDVCLILALWMSHHLWHENITFVKLNHVDLVVAHIQEHYYFVLFIILMLVIAAAIKSAQIPFSSWLPRAMEGPTTSSAVFYGSLSVHLGVFLLLRTYPYWETIGVAKIFIIAIGVVTAIIATAIANVQASVKTQIAYSSVAQIGIMFVEVAMGWHTLVLMHLVGNALLRTYQLLVSPSVLGYMIHDQFFNFQPKEKIAQTGFSLKWNSTIYMLSLKEWEMDRLFMLLLWRPVKWMGRKLNFVSSKWAIVILVIVYITGLVAFSFEEQIPQQLDEDIHLLFGFIGLILVLRSFVERDNAIRAWALIIFSQFFNVLSIALLNDKYEYQEILLYISGLLISAVIGLVCLFKLKAKERKIDLQSFYGNVYEYPILSFVFLMSCLGFVSLPFTPSFIGIDLMFSHIHKHEYLLIIFTALGFLLLEIAVLRIYARLFLGPHSKLYHPVAYRSS